MVGVRCALKMDIFQDAWYESNYGMMVWLTLCGYNIGRDIDLDHI